MTLKLLYVNIIHRDTALTNLIVYYRVIPNRINAFASAVLFAEVFFIERRYKMIVGFIIGVFVGGLFGFSICALINFDGDR